VNKRDDVQRDEKENHRREDLEEFFFELFHVTCFPEETARALRGRNLKTR